MAEPEVIEKSQVDKAVRALVAYVHKTKGKEMSLLNENEVISLQISVKKIPQVSVKPKRIPLPYTLHVPGEAGICLITKDKKEKVKALLKERGVDGVTKVVPIEKLRREFKSFEARIRLVDMYDLFLTDDRVYHRVPQYLGKKFYLRKKRPHPVNLRAKDLAKEISRARDATYLYLGRGPCSAVAVGHTGMPIDQIIHNVRHAVSVAVRKIPRGWKNIQSIHLKTTSSIALPLFNSLPAEPKLLGEVTRTEHKRESVDMEAAENVEMEAEGTVEMAEGGAVEMVVEEFSSTDSSLLSAVQTKTKRKLGSRKLKK